MVSDFTDRRHRVGHREGATRAGSGQFRQRRIADVSRPLEEDSGRELPKKGKKTEAIGGEPRLPVELEGALNSLYGNYRESFPPLGGEHGGLCARGLTPPVFIVVCNNTNVSKMVYDYIGGWESRSVR
ncbi:MAG: hypothetical protein R2853_11155 [Thermomicrobiales bacterium]